MFNKNVKILEKLKEIGQKAPFSRKNDQNNVLYRRKLMQNEANKIVEVLRKSGSVVSEDQVDFLKRLKQIKE